jgi:hypothetical protein
MVYKLTFKYTVNIETSIKNKPVNWLQVDQLVADRTIMRLVGFS